MNKQTLAKLLNSNAGLGATILRIPVGIILSVHGAQKLFAWFGGFGLEGTGQWMASIGLTPGYLMALLAGSAEFFGGIALIIGLLTRPAALVSAFTMIVAIVTVHLSSGFLLTNNGYEYALALLAATAALTIQGAGAFSIDNVLGRKLK
ncbi:DoxX family protein [Reinekea sp.]|jgi:putative oxidoreductase|uniref:DoxX family protein n=1 Tax=Reinekea sp. TaxID=1970455 RepID=UPI00398A2E64